MRERETEREGGEQGTESNYDVPFPPLIPCTSFMSATKYWRDLHTTWQSWSKKFLMDTFTHYKHVLWIHIKFIQFCKFVTNKQFKAKCMENVVTLIYTCLLNGNMLTGCSSAANCKTILQHTATCKGKWLWLCSTEP